MKEIIENEFRIVDNLGSFVTSQRTFKNLIKQNNEYLIERLANLEDTVNGVAIAFIYDEDENKDILSNRMNYPIHSIFQEAVNKTISQGISIHSYELIDFNKNIFTEPQLNRIGAVLTNKLLVYLTLIPFEVGNKLYIFGGMIVLNHNKYFLDRIYNKFGYDSAIFTNINEELYVLNTNSLPNSLFYYNMQFPIKFSTFLKNDSINKIININNKSIVVAGVPLKDSNNNIIAGLIIGKDLQGLNVILQKFKTSVTAVVFFSILVIALMGFIVYNDTKRPITGLLKAMAEVSKNNLDVRLDYKTYDEFEDVAEYFNTMVKNIKNYTTTLNRYNQLNQIITTSLDVDEVLRVSAEKILEYSDSQIAVVYLYDKEKQLLKPYYAKNSKLEELVPVKFGEGIVGEVAESKKYFCVKDLNPDNLIIKAGIIDIKPTQVAAFPLMIKNNLLGVMVIGSVSQHKSNDELELINRLLVQVAIVLDNCINHAKITELSIKDELTGVYNRRYLLDILDKEISKARRFKNYLSIGIFDIDDFKKINDKYGHPTGDLVLKTFAQIIKETKRDYDIFGRFGGEEFLIILPNTSSGELFYVLERLREAIQTKTFERINLKVTCSIGGASIVNYDNASSETLIATADKRLYEAKQKGKNRVEV